MAFLGFVFVLLIANEGKIKACTVSLNLVSLTCLCPGMG